MIIFKKRTIGFPHLCGGFRFVMGVPHLSSFIIHGMRWDCPWILNPPAMVVPPFIWVNYNDLTVLPHWKSWLGREMIPKWPYFRWGRLIDEAERPYFRLVKYDNLPRFMETPMVKVWPGKSTMLLRRWWTDCWNVEAPPPRLDIIAIRQAGVRNGRNVGRWPPRSR